MSNLNPDEQYPTPQKYLEGADVPKWYSFQSNLVTDADIKPGMIRCLEVDKRLTLPTRTHIRFLVTAADVIHSFSVPRYVKLEYIVICIFLVLESRPMQLRVELTRYIVLFNVRVFSTANAPNSAVLYMVTCQLLLRR